MVLVCSMTRIRIYHHDHQKSLEEREKNKKKFSLMDVVVSATPMMI